MSVESGGDAFERAPAVRGWGGRCAGTGACASALIQLAYVVGGIALGLVLPRIPVGFTVPAPRPRRCCSRWVPASSASSRSPSP